VKFRDILRTILESVGAVHPTVAETLDRMHKVGRLTTLRGTTTANNKVKPSEYIVSTWKPFNGKPPTGS